MRKEQVAKLKQHGHFLRRTRSLILKQAVCEKKYGNRQEAKKEAKKAATRDEEETERQLKQRQKQQQAPHCIHAYVYVCE